MIIDIIQIIINRSSKLSDQIRYSKINRNNYEGIYIYLLCGKSHHNSHHILKITQKVLEQKRYSKLVYLDFDNRLCLGYCNEAVFNLNHLANTLEHLSCPWNCGINQSGISELKKLKVLLCGSNVKINYVAHLANTLEVLDCSGTCSIRQSCISKLKLKTLNIYCNSYIHDINNMSDTLIKLDCGFSGLDQKGISELRYVKILDTQGNKNIHDVNHLEYLEELYCGSGIKDNGIEKLRNIKILSLERNYNIKCIKHLENTLEKLVCRQNQTLDNSNIKHARIGITSMKDNMYSFSDKYECNHLYYRYGMASSNHKNLVA